MGKSLREHREQNEEALKFFDGYESPPLRTNEWRTSIYIPAPLPTPKKTRTVFPGLNHPIAPRKASSSVPKQKTRARRVKQLALQGGRCAYCDDFLNIEVATEDHIKPQSKGGSDRWSNKVVVCHVCNSLKGDIMTIAEANDRIFRFTEFIARLAKKGYLK